VLTRLLKLFAILGTIFICCTVPYVVTVISGSGVNEAISFDRKDQKNSNVKFEEGGLLKSDEFNYFRQFSADQRFDAHIYKSLKKTGDTYEVSENFELKSLKRNDCKKTRCIQFKVGFPEIPLILSKGLIGIEDFRFLDHHGLDPISIFRALYHDIKAGKLVQGGSTLTQQLAKNLFFSNEKSFVRKLKEAILALYIEYKYEKSDILRTYFNEVYWGALQGIRIKGVQAASHVYFGKSLSSLTAYESSILVSMLKGPNYYHPIRRTKRLRARADFIFKKLGKLGLYGKKNQEWQDEQWKKWTSRLKTLENTYIIESIYLTTSKTEKSNQYRNYKLILESRNLLKSKAGINKNLSVKAVFGNNVTNLYYSRFERDLSRAITKEKHQIGSTIKPILYNLMVKNGIDLKEMVETRPVVMELISGKWAPRESHKIEESHFSYERALRESLNNPVIRGVEKIGFTKIEEDLKGIIPELKVPLSEYPAQLLGAVELSVKELFDVYSGFIRSECKTGMSVITALSDPTKTTIKRAVSKDLSKQEFFGKTGTTNRGFDNWFVGYDGQDLFVIWTGYEGNRNEVKGLPLYGSSTSFKIYQEVILYSGKRIGSRNCIF